VTPLLYDRQGAPLLWITEHHGRPELSGALLADHYEGTDE